MFTQSKTHLHNVAGGHGALSLSDSTDTSDQANNQLALASPGLPGLDTSNPFAPSPMFASGGAAFFAPPAAMWSPGLPSLTAQGAGGFSPAVAITTPGSGLVFDNTYAASCTAQYESCIVAAEKQLESLFTNSETISVTFQESNEGNNGDGLSNNFGYYTYSYATLKAALLKVAPGDVLPATDPSGGGKWEVPVAYARMLGLTSTTGSPDLTLTLNSYYNWDFGQDIINGVTHELSEGGMGRIGAMGGSGGGLWSTMDLFRYNGSGQLDNTNGRDGQTTYFSNNGGATLSNENLAGKGAPTLSFNNQYNSNGTKANGGDTADWTQEAVFGSVGSGETLALNQTELQVMQALGWNLSLKQDVYSGSGTWETPTSWSTGSMPIEAQDLYINGGDVSLDSNVIVNSIATNASSILSIGDSSATKLTAVDGTNLNTEDTSFTATGNLGEIAVYTGSTLQMGLISENFFNAGTLTLGKGAGGSGSGTLAIADQITLNGAGKVNLGQTGTFGDILNAPGTSAGSLINVNNTISGSGLIELAQTLDNQSDGIIEAQSALEISVGTFTNEGAVVAEANSILTLGGSGDTQSLDNTGAVSLNAGADLAIGGNYTVSGSGEIAFKGAGAEITSNGEQATFTNASTIDAVFSGMIGDPSLTFVNAGTVAASGSGVTLTIDTFENTVTNSGTMGAASGATLAIECGLTNQGTLQAGNSSSSGTTTGTLDLGQDGLTTSVNNTGLILIDPGSDLAISGNTTIAGTGNIYLKGAGADITSDGNAPATFTNASSIEAFTASQIGDVGLKSVNDLTFSNTGTVAASGFGATLTINTGDNGVTNTGTIAAANSASVTIVSNITNQGILEAGESSSGTSTGTLDLGHDGFTGAAVNTGAINVWGGSDLAISGDYTVSGSGDIQLKGAGSAITSDGNAPATFANASTIEAVGTSQIGDVGIKTNNDLTFVNTGSVIATLSGTELTINTGANTVNDSGGVLEAINNATLVIDSAVTTGTSGAIEAGANGTVLVNGALSGSGTLSAAAGGVLDLAGGGSFAGAIAGAGTVDIAGVTTLDAGATLSAADVVETSSLTLANVQLTNASTDVFDLTASSGSTITLARTGSGSFTNDGSLVVNGTGTARIAAPLIDNGTISITAGNLALAGAFSGTGALAIGAGTTADITAGGALTETISGAGKLLLGGTHTLAGAGVTVAMVEVNPGALLSGSGSLAGTVQDSGTLAAFGGTLAVGGKISGSGTLSAAAAAVLDLAGGGSFAGAITGAGTVLIAGTTTLDAGAKLLAADTVETANLTLANAAVTNAAGDSFAITAAGAATVTLGSTGTGGFTNGGNLVANGTGTAEIKAPFTNSGTVSALSGTMAFLGSIAGTGTLDLGASATVSLGLGAAGGQVLDFLGTTGTLDLSNPLDFAGTINDFAGSDQIFLENTAYTKFSFSNNLLTVKDLGATVANLNITESSNHFTLTNEHHGVLITFG